MLRLFIFFLFSTLYSCGQTSNKRQNNPEVSRLTNNIVPLTRFLDNPDSCIKALSFLDSATKIDNKCFSCYQNKLMFLHSLKQYNKSISTNDTLISLVPTAHDLYLTGGTLCEINQDTITAKKYFQKSLAICNTVLDTMQTTHRDYVVLVCNKSVNLKMLDDPISANAILKTLYDSMPDDPQFGNMIKSEIVELMGKTKVQLRESWLNTQNSR